MLNKQESKATNVQINRSKVMQTIASVGLITLLGMGIFAQFGWLPNTDTSTGKRNGWFGIVIEKNSPSSNWNPFPAAAPVVPPALSKEYIYAGDRMLAIEDYAQPTPTITPTPTPGGGGGGTPTPTPTPSPSPTGCTSNPLHVSQCEIRGQGTWNYTTCSCDWHEED